MRDGQRLLCNRLHNELAVHKQFKIMTFFEEQISKKKLSKDQIYIFEEQRSEIFFEGQRSEICF